MGNRIDDLASLYEAMGNTPRSHTAKTPNAIYRRLDPAVLAPADPAILDLYGRALALLSAAGARFEPLVLPCDLSDYQSRCGGVMAYNAYTCLKPTIDDYRRAVDPFVRRRVLAGRDISAAAHAQALALRVQDQIEFFAAFGPTDIPVLPTNPLPAPRWNSRWPPAWANGR